MFLYLFMCMGILRKYIREFLENKALMSENVQLADKVYFNTGKLSPEAKRYILHITGGDPYTKIISDIYYAEMKQSKKMGNWAISHISDEPEEEHQDGQDDVLPVEDWRRIREYHNQLKEYNKNVFPIKDLDINKPKDVWEIIRSLKERSSILKKMKELPKIALSNMREDIRTPRNSKELQNYRSNLEYFLNQYSLLSNRKGSVKANIEKKMFKSGVTLDDLIDFADEKQNLIGGKKLNKAVIKKIIAENEDELQIVFEKGNKIVVDVTGPDGIKAIGCNSVWCFTYGPGVYSRGGAWYQNSTNNHVYVIIDFDEESDSPYFMYVLIKPLDFNSEADDESGDRSNEEKMADMSNQFTDNPLGVIYDFMTPQEAYMIFNFGEHREGPSSKWPYENPNQLKLDLQEVEIRKMIRNLLKENKTVYPYQKIRKFVDWFSSEYGDYMNKQGWAIFSADPEVTKYDTSDGLFWQVQVIDDPEEFYDSEGNALIGISTDQEAWDRAAKLGIMLDEYGIIIGYNGNLFI